MRDCLLYPLYFFSYYVRKLHEMATSFLEVENIGILKGEEEW